MSRKFASQRLGLDKSIQEGLDGAPVVLFELRQVLDWVRQRRGYVRRTDVSDPNETSPA